MRWWLLLGSLATAGCARPGAFVCESDAQCSSGECEQSGYCSFPDESCPSMRRYGEHAGGGLARTCVDEDADSSSTATGEENSSSSTGSVETSLPSTSGPDSETGSPPEAVCGNEVIEPGETCDGNEVGGETCESLGWFAGVLVCAADCSGVDTSGCTNCGNGEVDEDEVCEGEMDLACAALGLGSGAGGSVTCNATCDGLSDTCGDPVCGAEPTQVFGPCPSICSICSDDTCVIDCTGSSTCAERDIVCPDGWACSVLCSGSSACADASIECPTYHRCDVSCTGGNGCQNLSISCGYAGSCIIVCGEEANVCSGARVECGADICSAQCTLPTEEAPELGCNDACACSVCN